MHIIIIIIMLPIKHLAHAYGVAPVTTPMIVCSARVTCTAMTEHKQWILQLIAVVL
jgi:K+ transporter